MPNRPGAGRKVVPKHTVATARAGSQELKEKLGKRFHKEVADLNALQIIELTAKVHLSKYVESEGVDIEALEKAALYAEKLAPYFHPKLSAQTVNTTQTLEITATATTEQLALDVFGADFKLIEGDDALN